MLAQFQSKYPQGNLITELVQIHHGKYIVRASVQLEGTTRATGMAAAEILEEAEDRARTRALMVLPMTDTPQESVVILTEPTHLSPNLSVTKTNGLHESANLAAVNSSHKVEVTLAEDAVSPSISTDETKSQDMGDRFTSDRKHEQFNPTSSYQGDILHHTSKQESLFDTESQDIQEHFGKTPKDGVYAEATADSTQRQDLNEHFGTTNKSEAQFDTGLENFGILSSHQAEETLLSGSPNNGTPFRDRPSGDVRTVPDSPFPSPSYSSQEDLETPTTAAKKKKKTEPVDQSDEIARIGVEMQRLGWDTVQGRDYLVKTYSKRSRHLLTPEELKDFLKYLESQPTPIDPLAGF